MVDKKSVNGNYIHSSWDTGSFVPIPEQFIVNNGAYCHIKGDISDNPKE